MAVMMDGKNFKVTCRPASPGECPAVMEMHCVSAQRGSHGSTWTLSTLRVGHTTDELSFAFYPAVVSCHGLSHIRLLLQPCGL